MPRAQRYSWDKAYEFPRKLFILRVALLLALLPLGFAQQVSFRITPLRPVEELRAEALKEQPPHEQGAFLKSDLVELTTLDPTIKLDIRYATTNNFLGTPVYTEARAFLQRPAAEALLRAHRELKAYGYGLIIHDGYRPWYVTKIFWEATPVDKRIFVADPAKGSNHNRGCAVDLSLYDLKTGEEVTMPSGYDEMSERAYADFPGGTADERARRALLRRVMEKQGFTVNPEEWWHFDYKDWKKYPNPECQVRGYWQVEKPQQGQCTGVLRAEESLNLGKFQRRVNRS